MNKQFLDCLKRERDIRIQPKLRDGKTGSGRTPPQEGENLVLVPLGVFSLDRQTVGGLFYGTF